MTGDRSRDSGGGLVTIATPSGLPPRSSPSGHPPLGETPRPSRDALCRGDRFAKSFEQDLGVHAGTQVVDPHVHVIMRALSPANCASSRSATVSTAVTMVRPVPTTVPMIHHGVLEAVVPRVAAWGLGQQRAPHEVAVPLLQVAADVAGRQRFQRAEVEVPAPAAGGEAVEEVEEVSRGRMEEP